ncbi:MAG: HD-GYP domain-containing protein [Pseudomonadota bacterium]
MLKRIPSKQLRVGMFLHELCGSWMEHPFWRSTFLIKDPQDIRRIIDAGIGEVWIDTGKGLDVASGATPETAEKQIEQALAETAAAPPLGSKVSMAEEAARAAKTCAQAKQAVSSMFQEARMGKAVSAEAALPVVEEISSSVMRNPGAIISLARLKNKDDYTYMHSVAVCALMVALAKQLNLNEEETRQAGLAGLLHDIGKMAIPLAVLNKPGKLTDAEFDLMKSHPVEGHKMLLEGSGIGAIPLDVCLHHHEKTDGSGYPDKLPAQQITLHAKMGAVCDVYDAITSNRPYKNGWEPTESLRKMTEWCEGHFDKIIFQSFIRSIGIYPVGSLVRLESGKLGVVVDQTEKSLIAPIVKVFFSIKSNAYIKPELINLAKAGNHDKIMSHEDPAKWKIQNIHEIWSGIAGEFW